MSSRFDLYRWTGGVEVVRDVARTVRGTAVGWSAWTLWLASFALVSSASAGVLSDARVVPPDAWMVFSVPSFPAAWNALEKTPLYRETLAILETPTVSASPGYRIYITGKRQIESELGFPLTGPSMAQIVAGFDFVFLPPVRDGAPASACIFRVKDAPRFRRLMDYTKLRMNDTAGGVPSEPAVKSTTYRGVEIVSFSHGEGMAVAELPSERFAIGNSVDAIHRIIDQARKRSGLVGEAMFQAAVEGLREKDPHGFLYLNTSSAPPALRYRGPPGLPLSTLTHTLRDRVAMAVGVYIEPEAIRLESYLPFVPQSHERMAAVYRRYAPDKLRSLDYISSSPLIFTARNTLDGPALYEGLREMALSSIRAMNPDERSEHRVDLAERNVHDQLGFDLKTDLAPAIGPEVFICLEGVRFDPLVPLPLFDIVAGIQVRDQVSMDKVVGGFEDYFDHRGPDGRPLVPLSTTSHEGDEIKSFPIPRAPLYSVGYVRAAEFVLLGLGGDSVKRALDLGNGRQRSFRGGGISARLRPYLHEECNEVVVCSVERIAAVGREITRRLARGDPEQIGAARWIDTLLTHIGRIESIGVSTAGSESGLHTRGAVVFRPTAGAAEAPPPSALPPVPD